MSNNDWKSRLNMVYSTNPDYSYQTAPEEEAATLPAAQQELKVWIDRKQRAGKQVTLIKGFVGAAEDIKGLAAMIKNRCGVGGSVKDGEIIIQGDFRDRVVAILLEKGYARTKKAGG